MTQSDISEIKSIAIPIQRTDDSYDISSIFSEICDASIIGLGEPSHGDKTSLHIKRAVIEAFAEQSSPLTIGWERGPGNVEQLSESITKHEPQPESGLKWLYPWVSTEALDLFRRIVLDETGQMGFFGVDMDGPAPHPQYESLIAQGYPVQDLLRELKKLNPADPDAQGLHHIQRICETLLQCNPDYQPPIENLLHATSQWAQFRVLQTYSEGHSSANQVTTAHEFRDSCLCDNVLKLHRNTAQTTTIFSAHNGHISRKPTMAGGKIAERIGSSYLALGIAFGSGRFNAGTANKDSFSPKLKLFESAQPPPGSLEERLSTVDMPCFAIDLRPLRGTSHVLSDECPMREVSLSGGLEQFSLTAVPSDYYDVLIWVDKLEPSSILRTDGCFW
ncbi:erythromycin esterase family protein [Loktanella sp. S4079]|uniref:erythromycin esterase family protein n=1 Tax=Loktanella sp. S4079 TaxID=579483 RepID=UPI0005FA2E6E|nr:erythromycin esterase family protein [Loktanella sp. S4079]KJZ17924.1 hypothetical protein TW80_16440 [Loktanella sp. S4079]